MRNRLIVMTVLASLFLFGCQASGTVENNVEESPTETVTTVSATASATALAPATDHCLECHTDQEKLTALAKPEVKAEGESKGVG